MIKRFLSMLKGMGKKGQFGPDFIEKHAEKSEKELREEIKKRLEKVEKGRQGRMLDSFSRRLQNAPVHEEFRDSPHFKKTIKVVNSFRDDIRDPNAEKKYTAELLNKRYFQNEKKDDKEKEEINRLRDEVRDLEKKKNKNKEKPPKRDMSWIAQPIKEKTGNFGSALFFVILAWLVYYLDKWMGFDGINISIFLSRFSGSFWEIFGRIFFNTFVVAALVWYFVTQWDREEDARSFLSYALLVFLTSLIVSFGAFNWGFYHIIMVYALYFFFIAKVGDELGWNLTKTRFIMCGLLFFDYFGFGILKYAGLEEIGNRYIIPIWSYTILWLRQKARPHWFNALALIALIVFSFAPITKDIFITNAPNILKQQTLQEAQNFWGEGRQKVVDNIKLIFANWKKEYTKQLEYATGGYYEGQVEENENLPLGVYFEDITSAAREFYVNEPVDIWGNLLVRTLDRDSPVTVSIDCQYEEERIPGTVRPEDNFTIYTMEEEAIECRFDERTIPIGTRVIKLTADFNFKTMAYLKSYMIDKDTLRSLRREEIDVFDHYGIRDKSPIAIFTNGPVKIGMETNEPPIGLSEGATPYLGITIENQWSGNIKDIRELEVQVPKGMKFFDGNCDGKFNELTEGELNPEHHTYVLNGKGRTYLKMPIEKDGIPYRSLRCLMKVYDKEMLLGDVPFTTKYFRATVSYDYELEHEVSVDIKKVPIISTYYETTIAKTNDELINYIDNKLKIERPDGEKGDFRGFIISNGLVKDLNIKLIDNSRIKEIINGELQGKNYNEETKEKIMGCYFGKILKQESNYHQFVKSGTTYPPYTKPGEDDNYKLVVNDKGKSNDGCCIGISQMNVKHKDKYSVYNLVVDSEYNVLKGLDLFLRYLAEKNGNLDEAAKAYNDGEEYSDHCSGEVDLTPVTTTTTSTTTTTTV